MKTEAPGTAVGSWTARRANDMIPVWVQRPENQEGWLHKIQSKTSSLAIQEEPTFPFRFESGKDACPTSESQTGAVFSYLREGLTYCSICFLQLIRWGPLIFEKVIYFIQSSDSKVNLILKHYYTHTSKIMFDQISGHLVAQSCWHIK